MFLLQLGLCSGQRPFLSASGPSEPACGFLVTAGQGWDMWKCAEYGEKAVGTAQQPNVCP